MVEAVIFDMDGVIIDSEPFYVAVEQEMFKMLGLVVSREEHAGYMGKKSDACGMTCPGNTIWDTRRMN